MSIELGSNYGESWTKEECEIANFVGKAWKAKICYSTVAIKQFIMSETGKNLDCDLLETVISKMNKTHETLLKQDPPFLKDEEYNQLKQYVKVNPKKENIARIIVLYF